MQILANQAQSIKGGSGVLQEAVHTVMHHPIPSIGAGGGGAGILDIGTPSVAISSNNKGGDGANGKLILEWWE